MGTTMDALNLSSSAAGHQGFLRGDPRSDERADDRRSGRWGERSDEAWLAAPEDTSRPHAPEVHASEVRVTEAGGERANGQDRGQDRGNAQQPAAAGQGRALQNPPPRQGRRMLARERAPLARAISDAVVPLLVLAHRGHPPHQARAAAPEAGFGEAIATLVRLALASDVEGARTLIERLHARGESFDTLYLEVITGAVRQLGQMWHDDRVSFADVTIGTLALQRLLHALDHAFCFCAETTQRDAARRILLAPRPGEPHGFALDMLDAFLRRAGWDVVTIQPRNEAALTSALRDGWFAVLGISDSCGGEPESLAGTIHAARRASQNRQLRVMVGGPAFAGDPDRAIRAGADATAGDASHAVTQAEGLFALVRHDA